MQDQPTDVAAMRSRAAHIRQSADAVRALQERVDHRVDTLAFEGPGAVRFRSSLAERSQRARRAAERLDEIADRIHAEAARLEQHAGGHHAA